MAVQRINKKVLLQKAAARGLFGITAIAGWVPCSRWSVYVAIENPPQVPKVTKRIKELCA